GAESRRIQASRRRRNQDALEPVHHITPSSIDRSATGGIGVAISCGDAVGAAVPRQSRVK
ncbi:MAG: hypothetical protein WBP49_06260, partial [Acidimicrobiia bacterium]